MQKGYSTEVSTLITYLESNLSTFRLLLTYNEKQCDIGENSISFKDYSITSSSELKVLVTMEKYS